MTLISMMVLYTQVNKMYVLLLWVYNHTGQAWKICLATVGFEPTTFGMLPNDLPTELRGQVCSSMWHFESSPFDNNLILSVKKSWLWSWFHLRLYQRYYDLISKHHILEPTWLGRSSYSWQSIGTTILDKTCWDKSSKSYLILFYLL